MTYGLRQGSRWNDDHNDQRGIRSDCGVDAAAVARRAGLMATGLSTAMRTELQGLSRVVPVFEITLDGTIYKFAQDPVASASAGMYKRRIAKGGWGQLVRTAGGRDMALKTSQMSVTIHDIDRTISKVIAGPASGTVLNATGNVYLRSAYVDSVDHYTLFTGVVADYVYLGDLLWKFILRPTNESILNRENNIPTILEADFANAPAASLGLGMQVIYGRHHGEGVSGATGMVPTVCVDSTNDWFLVSYGRVKTLYRTYRDGAEATDDFVLEYKNANGKYVSIVRDTAGTSTATSEITCDLDGIETVGDGSGTLITNPATQLEHYLTNFAFGNWPTGTPATTSPQDWLLVASFPIAEANFTETEGFLSDRNLEGSKIVASGEKSVDVINAFCKEYQVSPMWSSGWEIGVRPIPISNTSIYLSNAHIRPEHVLAKVTAKPLINEMVNRVTVNYLYNEAEAEYTKQRRVADPARTPILNDTQNNEWDRSHI